MQGAPGGPPAGANTSANNTIGFMGSTFPSRIVPARRGAVTAFAAGGAETSTPGGP
jgi:hypothetical protein